MLDMRVELTSPEGIRGVVLISEETGRTEILEGEGTDLEVACELATESVHGGIEPWVPPYNRIADFCEDRDIKYTVPGGLPDTSPIDPTVVY